MMFPLSDLRDPFAFLNGARVPLRSTTSEEAEWIADDVFYRICDSYERGFLCIRLDEDTERPTGIDPNLVRSLSLDLADPDVARWVDRRIAEGFYGVPFYAAVLDICDGEWRLLTWSEVPNSQEPLTAPCLAAITCGVENVPAARTAIVRALYGKETPCST